MLGSAAYLCRGRVPSMLSMMTVRHVASAARITGKTYTLHTMQTSSAEAAATKVSASPSFFRNSPVVLDVDAVRSREEVPKIVQTLSDFGLSVVALTGNSAEEYDMPVMKTPSPATPRKDPRPSPSRSEGRMTRVIEGHVRSGQQIHAAGASIVVLGSVHSGAEVIADNDIHIYGTLKGRALAGHSGNTTARIYAKGYQPEFVSISGVYRLYEELPPPLAGDLAVVSLEPREGALELTVSTPST